MGFSWLSTGVSGAMQAGGIALLLGVLLSALTHALAPRFGWREGSAIGVAFALTLGLAAGNDAWTLLYLSIVRMESPFVIQRTLGAIHDPAWLGTRVVFEFAGCALGVMLGWYLATAAPRWWRRRR
jgi:hypothetical protein